MMNQRKYPAPGWLPDCPCPALPSREQQHQQQGVRASVHAHPLKAVEPELFAPEDLLEERPAGGGLLSLTEGGEPSCAAAPGGDRGAANGGAPPGAQHQQGPHKWFAQWFGGAHGGEAPPDDDGSEASPLRQPPFVRRTPPSPTAIGACLLRAGSCLAALRRCRTDGRGALVMLPRPSTGHPWHCALPPGSGLSMLADRALLTRSS